MSHPQRAADVEVEWWFDVPDLGAVSTWLETDAGATGLDVVARGAVDQVDTYLDTADWRVYQSGFALRVRRRPGRGAEATLKALASTTSGLASDPSARLELTEPLPPVDGRDLGEAIGRLSGPVGSEVRRAARGVDVLARFTVRNRRRAFSVRGGDVERGEVALDDVAFVGADGRVASRLQRVEVEAVGDPHALEPFVAALAGACALTPARKSKFELGLAACGVTIPESG